MDPSEGPMANDALTAVPSCYFPQDTAQDAEAFEQAVGDETSAELSYE